MSKSLGNSPDPIELIEKFGSVDAVVDAIGVAGELRDSVLREMETAARLKEIPFLGEFAQGGVTRYITFEDVKKLVTSLVREMAAANGLVKGNK